MTEGVVAVGWLGCDLEADKGDYLRARVGEVVYTVRLKGDRVKEKTDRDLAKRDKQVENDADYTRERSVRAAHGRAF